MNNSNVTGRIARLDFYDTKTGSRVCKFTIASKRDEDNTDFIPCVSFGKIADLMERKAFKGQLCGVSGRLQSGSYEKDGATIYTLDLLVNNWDIYQWADDNNEYI